MLSVTGIDRATGLRSASGRPGRNRRTSARRRAWIAGSGCSWRRRIGGQHLLARSDRAGVGFRQLPAGSVLSAQGLLPRSGPCHFQGPA